MLPPLIDEGYACHPGFAAASLSTAATSEGSGRNGTMMPSFTIHEGPAQPSSSKTTARGSFSSAR